MACIRPRTHVQRCCASRSLCLSFCSFFTSSLAIAIARVETVARAALRAGADRATIVATIEAAARVRAGSGDPAVLERMSIATTA